MWLFVSFYVCAFVYSEIYLHVPIKCWSNMCLSCHTHICMYIHVYVYTLCIRISIPQYIHWHRCISSICIYLLCLIFKSQHIYLSIYYGMYTYLKQSIYMCIPCMYMYIQCLHMCIQRTNINSKVYMYKTYK